MQASNHATRTKVDSWAQSILCDPLNKSQLQLEGDVLKSEYGRRYPIVRGIYDLRLLTKHAGAEADKWSKGQQEYESWSKKIAQHSEEDYLNQRKGVEDVYAEIPIIGRCLDVGGNDGRLRTFLERDQEYISIDPFIDIFNEPRSEEFCRVYPFANEPLNFVAALAEHLPFASLSFDTVHMRSVIDHFLNPELALREAHRILRSKGQLIVGLTVEGGRTGRASVEDSLKKEARKVFGALGFNSLEDHHIWHPTYKELCDLISSTGFLIDKTHWQRSENDRVCYIRAHREN